MPLERQRRPRGLGVVKERAQVGPRLRLGHGERGHLGAALDLGDPRGVPPGEEQRHRPETLQREHLVGER